MFFEILNLSDCIIFDAMSFENESYSSLLFLNVFKSANKEFRKIRCQKATPNLNPNINPNRPWLP
jgi:hypothetical protein